MKPTPILVTILLATATASRARADVLSDFRAGSAVQLGSVAVDLGDGARTSSGSRALRKAPGSLDLTLAAADLGVALPITLHLRGAVLGDGHVEYTISQVFTPAVDLGGGQGLKQVTGRLVMHASPLPGLTVQDVGNARLRLVEPGRIVATGTFGTIAIAVDRLDLVGGVPQPPLAGLRDPSRTTICSDRVRTTRVLEVTLTGAARASGAAVQLISADRAGVHVPAFIVVRPGQRSARVTTHISPGYVGTVRVTAAVGGGTAPIDLVVRPRSACTTR